MENKRVWFGILGGIAELSVLGLTQLVLLSSSGAQIKDGAAPVTRLIFPGPVREKVSSKGKQSKEKQLQEKKSATHPAAPDPTPFSQEHPAPPKVPQAAEGLRIRIVADDTWLEYLRDRRIQLAVARGVQQARSAAYLFRLGDAAGEIGTAPATAQLFGPDTYPLSPELESWRSRGAEALGLDRDKVRVFTVYTSAQFAELASLAAAALGAAPRSSDLTITCAWERRGLQYRLMLVDPVRSGHTQLQ